MRVLQIIPHYIPAYRFGGPQIVAHGLGKSLVGLGYSVTVCTTNMADEETDLDIPIDKSVNIDGVAIFYEPVKYFRYFGFSPRLWSRIDKEVQKSDKTIPTKTLLPTPGEVLNSLNKIGRVQWSSLVTYNKFYNYKMMFWVIS